MMSYNGVTFAEVRTAQYSVENVYDDTGLDVLFQRITIGVSGIVNLEWCASNKTTASDLSDPNAPDPIGIPGDRMPISIERLRHTLCQPMKRLLFRIGNDLVIDSPVPLPDGRVPLRDLDFGPKPDPILDIAQVIGDVTALVNFKVTTCVNDCKSYILSNRWTMAHSIDQYGYTTRTTTGVAIVRADFVSLTVGLNADSFRKDFFVPVDAPLQRVHIDANLDESGTRLNYTITDVETTYTITTPGVVKIEGSVTASSYAPFVSDNDAFIKIFTDLGGVLAGAAVPKQDATFIIRVYGRRNTDRQVLYNTALVVASDRFSGTFSSGPRTTYKIAKLAITLPIGSMEEPYCEIRGQIYLKNFKPWSTFNPVDFATNILKFDPTFGGGLGWSPTASPTPMIGDNSGGKGNAVGFLAEVLSYMPIKEGTCALPVIPSQLVKSFKDAAYPK